VTTTLACSAPPDRLPTGAPALVGAWRSTLQFENGALAGIRDLEFMYVFNAGGTMTESSNYDGAPPVPPAYGVWRSVGPAEFEAKYKYYATRPPSGLKELTGGGGWLPSGRGALTERIRVSADGDSFTSTLRYDALDHSGQPIPGGGRAVGHAVRIRF
jgi:hypothetical protein